MLSAGASAAGVYSWSASGATIEDIDGDGLPDTTGPSVTLLIASPGMVSASVTYTSATGADCSESCMFEVINVSLDVLDKTGVVAPFLDIGHFGADGGASALTGYDAQDALKNAATGVFIDSDPDRFTVRVKDEGANVNPATAETIQANISTLMADGSVDDDATPVDLLETGPDTGVFESESMLLVSPDLPAADNPDDDVEVWSSRVGARGAGHNEYCAARRVSTMRLGRTRGFAPARQRQPP